MMDDFGDTSVSNAIAALQTSYGASATGTGPPSYYGAPSSASQPPFYYGAPSPALQPPLESYGVPSGSNIPSYLPLGR